MIGARCGSEAGVLLLAPASSPAGAARFPSVARFPSTAPRTHAHCGRQSVVSLDKSRSEPFDKLKLLRVAGEERPARSMKEQHYLHTSIAVAVLRDKLSSALIFTGVCVNPRVLSPEAAEFMLSVSVSQSILSIEESEAASHADLVVQGVHPAKFGPVLLVCTTTMFAAPVEKLDVEKAQRRAELWRKAVGPSFSVVPVVAGFALSPEVADFSKDLGVVSCNVSQ